MALSVNTNLDALSSQRTFEQNTGRVGSSLERLSTGLKFTRARDNAAGLVTSEVQRAQIDGLQSGIENIERANSLAQTAESALGEITGLLTTVRSLVADSANNGAHDAFSLAANQNEIDNLLSTIDKIAGRTKFGTIRLLDGTAGLRGTTTSSQVQFLRATQASVANGAARAVAVTRAAQRAVVSNAGPAGSVAVSGATASVAAGGTRQTAALGADETLTINGVDVALVAGSNATTVVNRINEFTSQTGVEAVLDSATGRTTLRSVEFGSAASVEVFSNIVASATSTGFGTGLTTDSGVDVAGSIDGAAATGAGRVLTGQFGTAADGISVELQVSSSQGNASFTGSVGTVTVVNAARDFQVGAFSGETASLAISGANARQLGLGVSGSQFQKLADIRVGTAAQSRQALSVVDQALIDVANLRGRVGAFQNQTLSATQSTLRTQLERLQDAESILRDTDFASEIARFASNQIRQQASTSVLGLANAQPQSIAALLRS